MREKEGAAMDTVCEYCAYFTYDEEDNEYYCDVYMDEDDAVRLAMSHYKNCPYFRSGDEYAVVRKQI